MVMVEGGWVGVRGARPLAECWGGVSWVLPKSVAHTINRIYSLLIKRLYVTVRLILKAGRQRSR